MDIAVAKAIGIQMWSSYHILRFYSIRERMFRNSFMPQKLEMLKEMEHIVQEEIRNTKEMIVLCNKDPRLGYHGDAEGYTYYPAKIAWRIEQLKNVLAKDFPAVKKMISNNETLFPEYTGVKPDGLCMNSVVKEGDVYHTVQTAKNWLPFNNDYVKWASAYDGDYLYFIISDETGKTKKNVRIDIEPQRLWPVKLFNFNARNEQDGYHSYEYDGKLITVISIPLSKIGIETQLKSRIRINIQYGDDSWIQKNPLPNRLSLNNVNPADLGWVLFKKQ